MKRRAQGLALKKRPKVIRLIYLVNYIDTYSSFVPSKRRITLLTRLNGNQTIEKFNVYNLMNLYIYIFTHQKKNYIRNKIYL